MFKSLMNLWTHFYTKKNNSKHDLKEIIFEWPNLIEKEGITQKICYEEIPEVYRSAGLFIDQKYPYVIMAGPFKNKPVNVKGLCLDESYYFDNKDWLYNIEDFSVPDNSTQFRNILQEVHKYGCEKKLVYMGCMGGIGRTGLALACLLKIVGVEDPINTVRSLYDQRAIETKKQVMFVENF